MLPGFVALPGNFERVERLCQRVGAYLGEGLTPQRVVVETQTLFVHILRGRLKQAVECGEAALALSERLGHLTTTYADIAAALAVAYGALGDEPAADRCFDALFQHVQRVGLDQSVQATFLYVLGRARWTSGRRPGARECYERMMATETPRDPPVCRVVRLMMNGLLELGERRYRGAEQAFREAAQLAEGAPHVRVFGNPHLMLALLYLRWDKPEAALAELQPVLAEHAAQGTPGFILIEGPCVVPVLQLAVARGVLAEFAAAILARYGTAAKPGPFPVPDTGATLTRREIEILRLLAAGQSNRGIADRLFINETTTKTHIAHIFQKLDVTSRTEAIARAHQLRLV